MRLLLYRNCQVLSVFSLEPSIGVSSLPCWNLEALRSLWCLRVWKKNKCIRSSNNLPLFPCILIFTMPSSAVKLWKWGPKYLKEEIRCWESSPATIPVWQWVISCLINVDFPLPDSAEKIYSLTISHEKDLRIFLPITYIIWLKGTVSRDFLLQVFFMNHLPPSPW